MQDNMVDGKHEVPFCNISYRTHCGVNARRFYFLDCTLSGSGLLSEFASGSYGERNRDGGQK